MLRNIVGLFKSREAAQTAQRDLHAAGLSDDEVIVVHKDNDHLDEVFAGAGMQEGDTQLYRAGLRRGETVVMARTGSDTDVEHVGDILDRHGPVNVQRRRRELEDNGVLIVPIVEEELRVGKRVVERGGIRIFVHVRTVPVEVPVTLRDETVTVERRAVNQTIFDPEAVLDTQQQTVEMHEIDEAPVVEKQLVVKEEVVVRKDVQERTETIRDTVRRTDVDIQKQSPGSSGSTSSTDADIQARSSQERGTE